MKRHVARLHPVAGVAALALCFVSLTGTALAQGTATYVVTFPSVGLVPGQVLRLNVFNPDGNAPLNAQVQLHNTGGILVGLADGSVRSRTFHSFDFKYGDIQLPGEDRTGRLQLNSSIYIRVAQPWQQTNRLSVSMETISISDGTSNAIFVFTSSPIGANQTITVGGAQREILIGIAAGETLRVTVLNPKPLGVDYLPSHVNVFDANGNLIQSSELTIPSGEARSFNFTRDSLPFPGEPGTDRIQLRIEPSTGLLMRTSARHLPTDVISFEVIENNSGRTTALSGEDCLVFYLGGAPN